MRQTTFEDFFLWDMEYFWDTRYVLPLFQFGLMLSKHLDSQQNISSPFNPTENEKRRVKHRETSLAYAFLTEIITDDHGQRMQIQMS